MGSFFTTTSDLPDRMKLTIILVALLGNFNSGTALNPEEMIKKIDETAMKVKELTKTLVSKNTEPLNRVNDDEDDEGPDDAEVEGDSLPDNEEVEVAEASGEDGEGAEGDDYYEVDDEEAGEEA